MKPSAIGRTRDDMLPNEMFIPAFFIHRFMNPYKTAMLYVANVMRFQRFRLNLDGKCGFTRSGLIICYKKQIFLRGFFQFVYGSGKG